MTTAEPYSITCRELAERGPEQIPDAFIPSCHLVYSSPATLSYNSPGAFGFGVKRAGLVIPESVMLLVAPGCCGRNSTILGSREDYAQRMYYLNMDETDLISGRHLKVIPDAVREILKTADPVPKAVVICITCVDALLGTDLERVCRRAEEETGVHVVPSTMYALTREGIKPPMTAIRRTIYSLLKKGKTDPSAVNLMGFFTPVDPESDLFEVLKKIGIRTVRQVSAMKTLEEYQKMGEANFNIVLNPESLYAAEDLKDRLGIPYIEMARIYDSERIGKQYEMFASAVGTHPDFSGLGEETRSLLGKFMERAKGTSFAVGQMLNANPFELAYSLARTGMEPKAVIAIPSSYDYPYIRALAAIAPETRMFSGISPTMLNYRKEIRADIAYGEDIGGYFPEAVSVGWNSEKQPFGWKGLGDLLRTTGEALSWKDF